MAESATQTITIAAAPEQVWAVVTDFERYPEWAKDVKQATVTARDEQGRGVEVEFQAAAIGRSAHYTLHYDYTGAPARMAWKLVEGDIKMQARQVFKNLRAVCAAAGTDFWHVVRVGIYLVDLNDFTAVNAVMSEFFGAPFPARSTIGVAALPKGARIEVDLVLQLD